MEKLTVMRFVGDHMILQRDTENKIFGRGERGRNISLCLLQGDELKEQVKGRTDDNGRWEVTLSPRSASFEPYEIRVTDGKSTVCAKDVLFGDLYHISGQSNMELPIIRTIDPFAPHLPKENRYIREFRMSVTNCFDPDAEYEDFLDGKWDLSEGAALMNMSGAGHYFAEELFERYNIPIGLVNTAAGGAPVEARMPAEMLYSFGDHNDFLDKATKPRYMEDTIEADRKKYAAWLGAIAEKDTVSDKIFSLEDGFRPCNIPFYFRDDKYLKDFNGQIWFRKRFTIPEDAKLEGDVLLSLGVMIDADVTYINGVKVGETGYMYPPRLYHVPADILRHGENTVYVRLEVHTSRGGFVHGKRYCIRIGGRIIDLSGKWEYIAAGEAPILEPDVFFQGLPLSMYAAMTAPAFNIRFKGLIWYQAESNGNAARYPFLFGEFVKMYRRRSGYDIPVIFAQLPNFADPLGDMPEGSWAQIREAQRKCLEIPLTAMSVNIDLGEGNDLHPINKWDVGKRLAYCAERLIYGEKDTPAYIYPVSASVKGRGEAIIHLNDVSKVTAPAHMKKFTAVDEQGNIFKADAVLSDDGIKLCWDEDAVPVKLRYLWENDPDSIELYCDGLPVTPFEIEIS